jgi:hypothetical protein
MPGASNHHFHPTRQRVICFHSPATPLRPATTASTMNAAIMGPYEINPPFAGMTDDQLMIRVSGTNSAIWWRTAKAFDPGPEAISTPAFFIPITAKEEAKRPIR